MHGLDAEYARTNNEKNYKCYRYGMPIPKMQLFYCDCHSRRRGHKAISTGSRASILSCLASGVHLLRFPFFWTVYPFLEGGGMLALFDVVTGGHTTAVGERAPYLSSTPE